MTSSFTVNNGLEKPDSGDQEGQWGVTLNTNFDIIDRVLSGVGSVSLSGTTHTLTTTDGTLSDGMFKVLIFGGSPSGTNTVTISPNDQDKLYFIVNSSGQSIIIKQGSGATVTIANGAFNIVYADGAGSGAAVASLLANDIVFGDDVSLQSDGAVLNFGLDNDVTLTHVADTGLILETAADSVTTLLQLLSDDAGSGAGPFLRLKRTSGSPADNDNGGIIVMDMENDNNQQFDAVQILAKATDVSDGSEDSQLLLATMVGGSLVTGATITGGGITLPKGAMSNAVLQVVTASNSGTANTTSTSYEDIASVTANITPQNSANKILVLYNSDALYSLTAGANVTYSHKVLRDSTSLGERSITAASGSGGLQARAPMSLAVLDSPSSASELTYKAQHKISNASSTGSTLTTHITLVEIAG